MEQARLLPGGVSLNRQRQRLISGTDVLSTEAGGEFSISKEAIRQLRRSFGLSGSQPMPHFEVLLQTRLLPSTV